MPSLQPSRALFQARAAEQLVELLLQGVGQVQELRIWSGFPHEDPTAGTARRATPSPPSTISFLPQPALGAGSVIEALIGFPPTRRVRSR